MKLSIQKISKGISEWSGSNIAFGLAVVGVLVWLISGPFYNFSNSWMIVITAITDVVIFLMVFSIQHAQNRDSKAIQLKLNELIVADKKARDTFIGLEALTDEEITELDEQFRQLLSDLDAPKSMRKLHDSIKNEKSKRSGVIGKAEQFVDDLARTVLPK